MSDTFHDIPYLKLLRDILDTGIAKGDRTGTGTISTFGKQMVFDLSDGTIPLLTTKNVHFKSIVHELLWFISGNTNTKYLTNNGVKIWNEWASKEGHLNNVYGYQWRKWENYNWERSVIEIPSVSNKGINKSFVPPQQEKLIPEESFDLVNINNNGDTFTIIRKISQKGEKNTRYLIQFDNTNTVVECTQPSIKSGQVSDPYKKTVCDEGCLGIYNEKHVYATRAQVMWYNMMRRCYDVTLPEYKFYGERGIFVDREWRCFANFLRDIHTLVNFNNWAENPSLYNLDKDYFNSDSYNKYGCIFLTSSYKKAILDNDLNVKYVATHKTSGESYETTIKKWLNAHIEQNSHIEPKTNSTYHVEKILPRHGYMFRQQLFIDQLQNAINTLKTNPESRRIIVSAWNPSDLSNMALEPCHYAFQLWAFLYPEEQQTYYRGEVSLMLNMRSIDFCIGCPFNIASYSLLLYMIGQLTNLKPKEFIWSGGDTHVYSNHIDQANEQLTRMPLPSPRIKLNSAVKNIDDFRFEDIELLDYTSHPHIKMPIAI